MCFKHYICVTILTLSTINVDSTFSPSRYKRNAIGLSRYSDSVNGKNIEITPNDDWNYDDPRNYYKRPYDNGQDYGEPNERLPIDEILNILNLGAQGRKNTPQLPHQYEKPNHQPRRQYNHRHIHHHIHYTLSDLLKLKQYFEGGNPNNANPNLWNFSDTETKDKTPENGPTGDEVIFGEEACPTGYSRVSKKCVRNN
ncbi:unnamed protein product [Parnassius apollo]|uniref:(apollo) hypothetical protein n=1 Tax=Parnassius apollo TaxID=110799 RepID=A0A8S3XAJ7_PARAO|nr:unnamed protein product [Parnassius apollo]